MRRFDLRALSLGEWSEAERRLFCDVAPFTLGGLEYEVEGGGVDLDLTVGRVGGRLTLHGAGEARLLGPCQRCLGDARLEVPVRCVDYLAGGRSEGDDDEPYVAGYVLELERWVRDAIADALPDQLLCRDDCRGLCPVCGVDRNLIEGQHVHDETPPP
jgi:uncharacterized protein